MPAVSFLKAAAYQDGHAGYSNPIDEQTFLVNTINQIEQSKFWKSTAIVVTYDDSDGWYDHQVMPIVNGSNTAADTPFCSTVPITLGSFTNRCGYGQRLPMLVISPWTRQNYVSHKLTNTASVTTFIEDNWLRGQRIGGGSFDAISGSLYATGRPAGLLHQAELPAGHPRPDHRRGRQRLDGLTRGCDPLRTQPLWFRAGTPPQPKRGAALPWTRCRATTASSGCVRRSGGGGQR